MADEDPTPEETQDNAAESETQKVERASVENLRVLENIDVRLTVEVGNAEIKIRDLLRLNEGSIVELDRLAGDPLDILVNDLSLITPALLIRISILPYLSIISATP